MVSPRLFTNISISYINLAVRYIFCRSSSCWRRSRYNFFPFVGGNSLVTCRSRQTNSLFSDESQINVGCCCCISTTYSRYTGRQVVHQDHRRVSTSYCACVTYENLRFTVPVSASTSLGLISKISRTFGRNSSPQDSKVVMLMVRFNLVVDSSLSC
jgi:hypothetical protein